jgi:hypothetical protein
MFSGGEKTLSILVYRSKTSSTLTSDLLVYLIYYAGTHKAVHNRAGEGGESPHCSVLFGIFRFIKEKAI